MCIKRLILFAVLPFGLCFSAFAQETLAIALDEIARFRPEADATISGTVAPVDATLSLDGAALTLDPAGRFSQPVTLFEGRNTFDLTATAPNQEPARQQIVLFRDTQPPKISISAPLPETYTNAPTMTVSGRAIDLLAESLALTRDGTPVSHQHGVFIDRDLPLTPGTNTFTYVAIDEAGNAISHPLAVHHKTIPPDASLSLPDAVAARSSFSVDLAFDPADQVVGWDLYLDETLVHQGRDDTDFSADFEDDGSRESHLVRLTVRDRFGNRAHFERTIAVAHPQYVFGTVLDDATSYPIPDLPVQLMTGSGGSSVIVTTDALGRFQAFLSGSPILARVDAPEWLPLARVRFSEPGQGTRFFDLRLTRRNEPVSTQQPFEDVGLHLTLSGFSGTARITPFEAQALPALLPLGYAPLGGFELTEMTGQGTLQARFSQLPSTLPPNSDVWLLKLDPSQFGVPQAKAFAPRAKKGVASLAPKQQRVTTQIHPAYNLDQRFKAEPPSPAWTTTARLATQGSRLDAVWTQAGSGLYLAVYRDPRLGEPVPAIGDSLIWDTTEFITFREGLDLSLSPKRVSILDEPQTRVTFHSSGVPTGSALGVIRCREVHRFIGGESLLPDYDLDLLAYHYGHFDDGKPVVTGSLRLRAHSSIERGHTTSASIFMNPLPVTSERPSFSYASVHDLGRLILDFGPTPEAPRAIQVQLNERLIPPLIGGATHALGFTLHTSQALATAPTLRYSGPDAVSLILLRRRDAQTWVYAGRLRQEEGVWVNDPAQTDLHDSGGFALVALDFPITELRGHVSDGGAPVGDVVVCTDRHPWVGLSVTAAGAANDPQLQPTKKPRAKTPSPFRTYGFSKYAPEHPGFGAAGKPTPKVAFFAAAPDATPGSFRFFLPQWPHAQTINAIDPATGRVAEDSFDDTSTEDLHTGVQLVLGPPDFRLLSHSPAHHQAHVARDATISLTFSHPLRYGDAQWPGIIVLRAPNNEPVPLHVRESEDFLSVTLRPRSPLADDTEYRLEISTQLRNRQDVHLRQATSFSFQTANRAVAGSLSLQRFTLVADGDQLSLQAPADAYPAGTELRLVNLETAWSFTEALTAGGYQRVLQGDLGDRFQLVATTPSGKVARLELDTVRTGPNQYMLGAQPFQFALNAQIRVHIDAVVHGIGREVAFRATDPATLLNRLNTLPIPSAVANGTVAQALEVEAVDGGPLPRLNGRLSFTLSPEALADPNLALFAVGPDIAVPLDPHQPEIRETRPTMAVMDWGAIVGGTFERGQTAPAAKRNRQAKRFSGLILTFGLGLSGATRMAFALYAGGPLLPITTRSLRQDVREATQENYGNLFWVEGEPDWYQRERFMDGDTAFYPIQSAYVYRLRTQGEARYFDYLGATGTDGSAVLAAEVGIRLPALYALDPATGQFSPMRLSGAGIFSVHEGLLPWPEEGDTRSQARVRIDWEVVEEDDEGNLVVADRETQIFQRTGALHLGGAENPTPTRHLRAIVKADRPLDRVELRLENRTTATEFKPTELPIQIPVIIGPADLTGNLHLKAAFRVFDQGSAEGQDFVHHLFLKRGEDGGSIANVAPMVLSSQPYDGETDILVAEPMYLEFSEPVSGISAETVVVSPQGGDPVTMVFTDGRGIPIDADDFLTELVMYPAGSLKFATGYQLDVNGLVDRDGDRLTQYDLRGEAQPFFRARFRTLDARSNQVTSRTTADHVYTAYRNIVVHAYPAPGAEASQYRVDLINTHGIGAAGANDNETSGQTALISSATFRAPGFHFADVALFPPRSLEALTGQEVLGVERGNRERLKRLPDGTLIVVKFNSPFQVTSLLHMLKAQGGKLVKLGQVRARQWIKEGAVDAIGPYLITGWLDIQAAGPLGFTEVRDLRPFLTQVAAEAALAPQGVAPDRFQYLWDQNQPVARYLNPSGIGEVAGFRHRAREGFELAFATMAYAYPGAHRIDTQANDLVVPVAQHWDPRALLRTVFPPVQDVATPEGAPGRRALGRMRVGIAENFAFIERTESGLAARNRDVAVYGEHSATRGGFVYLHDLPETPLLDEVTKPRFTLVFPNGMIDLAVDRDHGLLAVTTKNGSGQVIAVCDLRVLFQHILETGAEQHVVTDPAEDALFLATIVGQGGGAPIANNLFLHDGALFYSSSDQSLQRLPLRVVDYRSFGWLAYDLAQWQTGEVPTDDNGNRRNQPRFFLTHQPYAVLYATDLDLSEGGGMPQLTFTTEVGSYEVELFPKETLELTFEVEGGAGWSKTFTSAQIETNRMVGFHTGALAEYLQTQARALREHGFLAGKVHWKVTRTGQIRAQKSTAFLIAWRPPATRYRDPYRTESGLDLVAGAPDLFQQDLVLSARDPRVDLSLTRVHARDYAFSPGAYGVGMLDGTRLYQAMPAWWRPGTLPQTQAALAQADVHARLILEQPGRFQVEADVTDEGKTARLRHDPLSSLRRPKAEDPWVLIHDGNLAFTLFSRFDWPEYTQVLADLNTGFREDDEQGNGLRLPLMRPGFLGEAPAPLFTETLLESRQDRPWRNRMWATAKERYPETLHDLPNDGGGERRVKRIYLSDGAGTRIATQRVPSLSATAVYGYDGSGYLTQVSLKEDGNPEPRNVQLTWSPPLAQVGRFALKRLERIEASGVADPVVYEAVYGQADSLTVSEVGDGAARRQITRELDAAGRVTSAILAQVDAVPAYTVTFGETEGAWLSSGYSFQGEESRAFSLTWARRALTPLEGLAGAVAGFDWFLTGNSMRDQTFDYDAQGRMTHHEIDGGTWQWTWHNAPEFAREIASQTNPLNHTLVREVDPKTVTLRDADGTASVVTQISASGVPLQTTGLLGLVSGSTGSHHYRPINGDVHFRSPSTLTLRLPGTDQDLATTKVNAFGEAQSTNRLGKHTTITRDALGRPTQIERTDLGHTVTYDYAVVGNHRQMVVTEAGTDIKTTTRLDTMGRIVSQTRTAPGVDEEQRSFHYDALSRLRSIHDEFDELVSYTYYGDTDHILTVDDRIRRTEYEVAPVDGKGITVAGATVTLQGQPGPPIHLKTDVLGRVEETTMPHVGKVKLSYDLFGRVTGIAKADGGDTDQPSTKREDPAAGKAPVIEVMYDGANKRVTVADGFQETTSTLSYTDTAGLAQSFVEEDGGLAESLAFIRTVSLHENRLVIEQQDQNRTLVDRYALDGYGNLAAVDVGFSGMLVDSYHVTGAPEIVRVFDRSSGTPVEVGSQSYQFDSLGRIEGGTTLDDLPWRAGYDTRSRMASMTDTRGLTLSYAYDDRTDLVSTVQATGAPYRGEDGAATLFQRDAGTSVLNTESGSWLGDRTQTALSWDATTGTTATTRKGFRAAVTEDPIKSEVTEVQDYLYNRYGVEWEAFGRKVTIQEPNCEDHTLQFDAYGEPTQVQRNGKPVRRITRDGAGRVTQVERPGRVLKWKYNQTSDLLESIVGGTEAVTFSDWSQGRPGQIDVGQGRLIIDATYHKGGEPAQVTYRPKGGLPTEMQFNPQGDLVCLRRGNRPASHYTYNAWGAVETLRVGAGPILDVFQQGRELLNLPGAVQVQVDAQGRLSEVHHPGLQVKTYSYDANGRLKDVQIGGQPLRQHTYQGIFLNTIRDAQQDDVWGFDYTGDQGCRLQKLTRNDEPWQSWTYLPPSSGVNGESQSGSGSSGGSGDSSSQDAGATDGDPTVYFDRVHRATDPNGVTITYGYDPYGHVNALAVAAPDGSETHDFSYLYDEHGNQMRVTMEGLSVGFEDWSQGMPGRMIWGDGTEFTITRTEDGHFDTIRTNNGAYVLDLDWASRDLSEACPAPGTAGPPDSVITQVTRRAPGLEEVWTPTYSADLSLTGVRIDRTSSLGTDVIEERYGDSGNGVAKNKLLAGLTRVLNGTVLVQEAFCLDGTADERRISEVRRHATCATEDGEDDGADGGTPPPAPEVDIYAYDPALGHLTQVHKSNGDVMTYGWDGFRRLIERDKNGTAQERFEYDIQHRRVQAAVPGVGQHLVFAWHGSRVIAIGERSGASFNWTHAIGYGPFGPVFLRDLSGETDYYILTDHLGTPFAYKKADGDEVYFTPYSPWGELLATKPGDEGKPGQIPNKGFHLPPGAGFRTVSMGIGGHLIDHDSGLVNMHHRFYDPRLGHFLNPDYRIPDLYDPSTVKEPYAYAAGNPVLYWDPDGLYARSIHGYFTYLTALAAGLSEDRAREIAFFTWGPDATESLNAIGAIKLNASHGDLASLHSIIDVQQLHVIYPSKQSIGMMRGHAAKALQNLNLPELNRLLQWETTYRQRYGGTGSQTYKAYLSEDQLFGMISHYFQDSYSHTDSSMVDDPAHSYSVDVVDLPYWSGYALQGMTQKEIKSLLKPNRKVQVPYKTFTSPFGHFHPEMNKVSHESHHELGAEEDDPFLKPKVFQEMASTYYDLMVQFAKKTPGSTPRVSKSEFMGFVHLISQTTGKSASSRDANRHKTIQNIIRNMGDSDLQDVTLNFLPGDGSFLDLIELLENAPSQRRVDVRVQTHGGFPRK
ncbi:Ig-like domain-containing protein [Sulfidibacter corallicola]|uniref:Ig-like domain-containing protein n=1 Tax=Sulfidibacter corallicola TaxID=2818388 RepID=A0A8A4THR7_SULCO|nr:Ig-like domain-containing protein [Sulfidibacter corallicola]QTD48308.1 Ig-like domain-containing protein [Sulfidibacter corallicola]